MTRLSPFLAWVAELPQDAVQPRSARAVLAAVAAHADGGREDPAVDELASLAGCTARSVERHIAAMKGAFVEVEDGRSAEGRWRPNRYRLLAPLNVVEAAEAHRAAVSNALDPNGKLRTGSVDDASPDDTVSDGRDDTHDTTGRQSGGAGDGVSSGAEYKQHAGVRARPVPFHSNPLFIDFDFGGEDLRQRAHAVLRVCGVGMAALDERTAPGMLGSLAQLLATEWAAFDLTRDVLPVITAKTGYERERPLRDFWLLTDNIRRGVEKRQLREARAREGADAGVRGEGGRASRRFEREARPASQSSELDKVLARHRAQRDR